MIGLALSWMMATGLVLAQSAVDSATLSGTVMDPTEKPVGEASVVLVNKQTGQERTGLSAADGAFRFLLVPPGVYDVKGSKTGLPGLPDSQDDVGGWDNYPEVHRAADWDTDGDGIPDAWEKTHTLNPKDATDGNKDLNGDGYTNLEKYINNLVGEYPMPAKK